MATNLADLVSTVVDRNALDLGKLSRFLWEHPELALKEVEAHKLLTDFLENRGFSVQRHYHLETAFKAEFHGLGGPNGPCVALLCEYDALPDIGHACGHNLIAEASVGAALAVQEAMKTLKSFRGKLVILGTPAEESFGGKELLIRKGALQGVDAAIMSHPGLGDALMPEFSATQQLVVRFRGKAAHAAASPWEGLNALDAAVASYTNIGLLRQQLRANSRIHGVITEGGKYANIVPEETELRYSVRALSTEDLIETLRKAEACIKGAGEATGCTVSIEKGIAYMHVIHNHVIAKTYQKQGHSLDVSFLDDVQPLPPTGAGTDCGNVSHRVPTLHAMFGIAPPNDHRPRGGNHTRDFAALANSEESQPATLKTAKILALTALDLLMDAELLRTAKEEFAALRLPQEMELQMVLS